MSFWDWFTGSSPNHEGVTPNDNPDGAPGTVGTSTYSPGDPEGLVFEYDPVEPRHLSFPSPSPWSGWPSEWSTPDWHWSGRFSALVDVAWACIDRSATVLSGMPVYRTREGRTVEPASWMTNPDPSIYTSWEEFAKQLFRDFQMGEAFVLPMARSADGSPLLFRVVPPWMMNVEMRGGRRLYRLGGPAGEDVTDDILHIRYESTTDGPRGKGPLEVAGGRQITAGLLEKYARNIVETGGAPIYTLETESELNDDDAQDLLNQWIVSRQSNFGAPAVLDGGVTLKTHWARPPREMALMEIATFSEVRIAVLTGVPPFLVGLPSVGSGVQSLTYANVSQVFDQHDRLSLRPMASTVMGALSAWALPPSQRAELNRDEYSRPGFNERVDAYEKMVAMGAMSVEEVRAAERLVGETPEPVTDQLLSKPDPEGEVQLRRVL